MATRERQSTVTLRLRRTFAASRERVFRAWTTPHELKRWDAPGDYTTPLAEVDLRPGGQYRIHMQAPDGTVHRLVGLYRVVEPPQKLVYTWRWEGDPDAPETLVTVEFLDRGAATEVVLTHELFPSAEARQRHETGWMGCLEKLARLVNRTAS